MTRQPAATRSKARFTPARLVVPGLLLSLAGWGFAQEPATPAPGELFEGAVDVSVVNVEVHVVDEKGEPVTGLGPDDFAVYENGQEMPITNFYAVSEGDPVDPVEIRRGAFREVPEEGVAGRFPAYLPSPEQRQLHLVLYVDNLNLSPIGRQRVMGEIEPLIEERLYKGDRVMVVSSYPSLTVHTPFTHDLAEVRRGVSAASERVATSRWDMDRRRLMIQIARLSGANDPSGPGTILASDLEQSIRIYAEQRAIEQRQSAWELTGLVGSLAGLPGRKAVIHLSEGVPERPGEELFNLYNAATLGTSAVGAGRAEAAGFDITRDLIRIAEEANASGVTFFTLDVSGGEGNRGITPAESRGLTETGNRVGGPEVEAFQQINEQNPLRVLADATGGRSILNAARPGVVLADRQGEDLDSFYSLGYQAADSVPGEYRKIEVEVKRPGVEVRHRQGYRLNDLSQRLSNRTVAALLHDQWQNPLRIYLEVGEPEKRKRKRFRVPVAVKVPLDQVTLLPFADDHRGRLRVRIAFSGGQGPYGISDEQVVPLVIPKALLREAQRQHYTLSMDLELDPGPHRLAVSVYDEVGAESSFLPYDLFIGGS